VILDELELRKITGKTYRPAQQRALVEMKIEHIARPDGSLVVARARVEHLLGVVANAKVATDHEPDFAALAQAT
jgi:hypothetical protein